MNNFSVLPNDLFYKFGTVCYSTDVILDGKLWVTKNPPIFEFYITLITVEGLLAYIIKWTNLWEQQKILTPEV